MSRSNYNDDIDPWDLIRWRGAVKSAVRGTRGQALLRELLAALDAMPQRELVASRFEADGEFCALGVLGKHRGIEVGMLESDDDDDDTDTKLVAKTFGVADALVREIMDVNDRGSEPYFEYEAQRNDHLAAMQKKKRWQRVRDWVAEQLAPTIAT